MLARQLSSLGDTRGWSKNIKNYRFHQGSVTHQTDDRFVSVIHTASEKNESKAMTTATNTDRKEAFDSMDVMQHDRSIDELL